MATPITITLGSLQLDAELTDSPTTKAILSALPLSGLGQRWGDEIYFSTSVQAELEPTARDILEQGELGFWPPGNAFCIFWGPTPASIGQEIRAASQVNIIGRILGDLSELSQLQSGVQATISLNEKI